MSKLLILKPYTTEKTGMMPENKFAFLSFRKVNKIEVMNYFASTYEVSLSSVNILKKLGKKQRRGKKYFKTPTLHKVIITLKDTTNIDKIKNLY